MPYFNYDTSVIISRKIIALQGFASSQNPWWRKSVPPAIAGGCAALEQLGGSTHKMSALLIKCEVMEESPQSYAPTRYRRWY